LPSSAAKASIRGLTVVADSGAMRRIVPFLASRLAFDIEDGNAGLVARRLPPRLPDDACRA
jgi:hypothetical protein